MSVNLGSAKNWADLIRQYISTKSFNYSENCEAAEEAENIEETEDISSMIDIRNGARESCMTKWQRQWEVSEKGRHLFKFRPNVDTKDKFTEQSKFPSIIRQLRTKVGRKIPPPVLTGGIYRYFPAWQKRLKWQIMENITFLPRDTTKYDFLL